MRIGNIFKPKRETVDKLLKNDQCKKLLDDYIREDLNETISLIIIYETEGNRKQTYWKCAGMEPAQAILSLDQLHHRIQHEGLNNYD